MRPALVLAVACALLAAGCFAKAGEDPFAYTKKPLYTGGFDLEDIKGEDSQQFRVEDGSIALVRVQVWVNATAGGARVELTDPSGRVVLTTTEGAAQEYPLKLGIWTVKVTPVPDASGAAAGHVAVLATRG